MPNQGRHCGMAAHVGYKPRASSAVACAESYTDDAFKVPDQQERWRRTRVLLQLLQLGGVARIEQAASSGRGRAGRARRVGQVPVGVQVRRIQQRLLLWGLKSTCAAMHERASYTGLQGMHARAA